MWTVTSALDMAQVTVLIAYLILVDATCSGRNGIMSNNVVSQEDSSSEGFISPDDSSTQYAITQDIKFSNHIDDNEVVKPISSEIGCETMPADNTQKDSVSDSTTDNYTTTQEILGTNVYQTTAGENSSSTEDLFIVYGYPLPGDIPILNRKIFRGARVSVLEHPYIASIRRMNAHYLTGTLISEHLVITVAHPLYQVPTWELVVVAGENYSDRGAMQHTVLFVVTHQDFNPFTLMADLALLRVYEKVKLMTNRKVVPMYSAQKSSSYNGTKRDEEYLAYVTGWGRCDFTGKELCMPRSSVYYPDEKLDPMLRTITFKYVIPENNHYCNGYERHQVPIREGMLCAGEAREQQATAPCLAVPGAPLVLQGWLLGVQSWGFGCGFWHDLPLIYTDINHYEKWIQRNIHIMSQIEEDDFEELFIATKAYVMMEWMLRTRVEVPEKPELSNHELKISQIDHKLIDLVGVVTDFRDYFGDGVRKNSKQNMYKDTRIQKIKEKQLKNISETFKLREGRPFLDPDVRADADASSDADANADADSASDSDAVHEDGDALQQWIQ